MSLLSAHSRLRFALLSAALFQALAIAGFVADSRTAHAPSTEGRTIASSSSPEVAKLSGAKVLVTKESGYQNATLLGVTEDGRYEVRHLEEFDGQTFGHTQILRRDDFILLGNVSK